jgi:hypothetical protein
MDELNIERLTDLRRVDIAPGFFAITRSARLREVLADVLDLGAAVLAATRGSLLVGYTVDLPFVPIQFDDREWSRRWLVPDPRLEDQILIGEGLVWHWDHEARGLYATECRAQLLALFGNAGFRRYRTDEPEIRSSPYNFLIARSGPRVAEESRLAFEGALFRP